jgi:hypothetical protein
MTSPVKENFYISVSKKEKSQNMKWRGYNLNVIRNCEDANRVLNEILEKKRQHEYTPSNKCMG